MPDDIGRIGDLLYVGHAKVIPKEIPEGDGEICAGLDQGSEPRVRGQPRSERVQMPNLQRVA